MYTKGYYIGMSFAASATLDVVKAQVALAPATLFFFPTSFNKEFLEGVRAGLALRAPYENWKKMWSL